MKDFVWWDKWIRGGKALPESVPFWVGFADHGEELIPRQADNAPRDLALFELNYNFAKVLQEGERKEAAKLLRHMRKRADELIDKMEADAIGFLKKLGYKFD